jgi:hypothetical protein
MIFFKKDFLNNILKIFPQKQCLKHASVAHVIPFVPKVQIGFGFI